jgi:hypothetical protein
LKAEITDEIRLITAGRFTTASGHEEEDHRAMDFVADPKSIVGWLSEGRKVPW